MWVFAMPQNSEFLIKGDCHLYFLVLNDRHRLTVFSLDLCRSASSSPRRWFPQSSPGCSTRRSQSSRCRGRQYQDQWKWWKEILGACRELISMIRAAAEVARQQCHAKPWHPQDFPWQRRGASRDHAATLAGEFRVLCSSFRGLL